MEVLQGLAKMVMIAKMTPSMNGMRARIYLKAIGRSWSKRWKGC